MKAHSHGVWLVLLLGEVKQNVALVKYREAVDSGKLGIDDLVDQANGFLHYSGVAFLEIVVGHLYRKTRAVSPSEAGRLIDDLTILTDRDWRTGVSKAGDFVIQPALRL